MKISLEERVILVTGATQGIGAAVARAAAGAGVKGLALTGRDIGKAEALVADLRAAGVAVAIIAADLARPEAPAAVFDAALKAFGRIDGLVNAAGLTTRGGFEDGTLDDWDILMAVNARAPFLLMQGLIRHLVGRSAPGSIVNIASINAHCGSSELAMYSASKGALVTLTRNAAAAYMSRSIRVNAINMGWSATPGEMVMQGDILGKGPGWAAEVAATLPLGRFLTAEEVAAQVLWLLSDASGLQTGTVIDLEQRVIGAP
jgi:NAD(P)-dependent dehydrogenase (short-subunit alcohol dehydrogenase family)